MVFLRVQRDTSLTVQLPLQVPFDLLAWNVVTSFATASALTWSLERALSLVLFTVVQVCQLYGAICLHAWNAAPSLFFFLISSAVICD